MGKSGTCQAEATDWSAGLIPAGERTLLLWVGGLTYMNFRAHSEALALEALTYLQEHNILWLFNLQGSVLILMRKQPGVWKQEWKQ